MIMVHSYFDMEHVLKDDEIDNAFSWKLIFNFIYRAKNQGTRLRLTL